MTSLVGAWVNSVAGVLVLVAGGELLVRGASRFAAALNISPLVIGLTVVAFGTSAPELAVSVQAALAGTADLALGNVVGSNIFNVLFILGVSAIMVPLVVSSRLIRWDIPVMIVASLVLLAASWDGRIDRFEGLGLVVGVIVYTYWCVRQSRRESKEVQAEFAHEWPNEQLRARPVARDLVLIAAGLIMLGLGSRFLVDGAVRIAQSLGVSELVIGLTVVAAGTSLPEVVTSVVAAVRGERDIAVGNVVGSNIFNILCVLGLSSVVSPSGVSVSSTAMIFDVPVMIMAAVACLPIAFTGNVISRWEGGLFLVAYGVYVALSISIARGTDPAYALRVVTMGAAIPLIVLLVLSATGRSVLWRRAASVVQRSRIKAEGRE